MIRRLNRQWIFFYTDIYRYIYIYILAYRNEGVYESDEEQMYVASKIFNYYIYVYRIHIHIIKMKYKAL